jgi:hypothetical protein
LGPADDEPPLLLPPLELALPPEEEEEKPPVPASPTVVPLQAVPTSSPTQANASGSRRMSPLLLSHATLVIEASESILNRTE